MSAREVFGGGVAVITGSGAGIGAGLARHASALGMTVVLADIDAAAVDTVADELTAAGGRAVPVVCDVRNPASVEALAERAYSEVGPVRLLVNNAGVEQFGYLWDTPLANWNRVVDVNISGVFHGIRAFMPRMIRSATQAWVWNLSSIGGVAVVPLQSPYIMSKHAVLALTECLHLEVAHAGHNHIHVQAVLPGRRCPTSSNPPAASTGTAETPQRQIPALGDAQNQSRRNGHGRGSPDGVRPGRRRSVLSAHTTRLRRGCNAGARQRACQPTRPGAADRSSFRSCAAVTTTRPVLDPDAAARVAAFGAIPPMRQRGLSAVRQALEAAPLPENMPAMAAVEDHLAPSPGGPLPLRIYRSHRAQPGAAVMYFHGGGMVLGSNHSFEPLARMLAAASAATVVSVDYRLAPEHPAPAQFDDAYTATTWVGTTPISSASTRLGSRWLETARAGPWLPRWLWRHGTRTGPRSSRRY